MPSGKFATVSITSIIVDRENRQRRVLSGIEELKQSIARRGLINPITITRDGQLIAGERRYTAICELGLPTINVQYVEDLDPLELQLIELDENLKRLNLPWVDTCDAVSRYHKIASTLDPEWSHDKTADALGMSKSYVPQILGVQTMIDKGHTAVAKAETFNSARNQVQRIKDRAVQAAVQISEDKPTTAVPLINEDFHDWCATYVGPKFNLLHCDFPYGINFQNAKAQGSSNQERYEDTFQVYKDLIATLAAAPVAESAHMIFWFSLRYYALTRTMLSDLGWTVHHNLLIWGKSDNSGILADPQRGFRNNYETAFFCARGDRKIVRAVGNIFWGPRGDVDHPSQKSVAMLKHFLTAVTDSSSHFLDPTCGSGGAVRVAKDLGAARVLGIEKDPTFYADAVRLWKAEESENVIL